MQVIAVVLVLILLAVTNPPAEKHRKAVVASFSREHEVVGLLGGGYVYSGLVAYSDYTFFSVTRDAGEIKSVGVLGFVFTL
jgi:hypothetical protein